MFIFQVCHEVFHERKLSMVNPIQTRSIDLFTLNNLNGYCEQEMLSRDLILRKLN